MIDTNYLMDNKINNGISIQTCNIFWQSCKKMRKLDFLDKYLYSKKMHTICKICSFWHKTETEELVPVIKN